MEGHAAYDMQPPTIVGARGGLGAGAGPLFNTHAPQAPSGLHYPRARHHRVTLYASRALDHAQLHAHSATIPARASAACLAASVARRLAAPFAFAACVFDGALSVIMYFPLASYTSWYPALGTPGSRKA